MAVNSLDQKAQLAAELLGSFTLFKQFFFPLVEGREWQEPKPIGREPHTRILARALTQIYRADYARNTYIMIPPRHFKSTDCCYFIAWTMASHPRSRYLYISYGAELAAEKTEIILKIIMTFEYGDFFGVYIDPRKRAKDNFANKDGGCVKARGLNGQITGSDAGLPFEKEWTGCVVIDDAHKPDEVFSDTMRTNVIKNYQQTVRGRTSSPRVPIIFLGHALHEEDLGQYIKSGKDILDWEGIILPALDDSGNALAPEVITSERLLAMKLESPYVFWSQYQQTPTPAGGSLFLEKWFAILDYEPEMLVTFVTADTAETAQSWNDATSFTFCGVYHLLENGRRTGEYGLHVINNWEIRVEPKDLEYEFMKFYDQCMLYVMPPKFVAIEIKSTGSTLASVVKERRGMLVREIERNANSGNKAKRFIDAQYYIAKGLVSLPRLGRHSARVVSHMGKISAASTQAHDDIADTICDAITLTYGPGKIALGYVDEVNKVQDIVISTINKQAQLTAQLRQKAWQRER